AQKSQPIGLAGRRELIRAPTVANTSNTSRWKTLLLNAAGSFTNFSSSVIGLSARASAQMDQASQAAVRVLIASPIMPSLGTVSKTCGRYNLHSTPQRERVHTCLRGTTVCP